jgi:hypothetical protein
MVEAKIQASKEAMEGNEETFGVDLEGGTCAIQP